MEQPNNQQPSDEWICAHFADDYASRKGSVSMPIYQSSTHIFESCEDMTRQRLANQNRDPEDERGYFYGRNGNPTVDVLERKLAALERTDACLCFGSAPNTRRSTVLYIR